MASSSIFLLCVRGNLRSIFCCSTDIQILKTSDGTHYGILALRGMNFLTKIVKPRLYYTKRFREPQVFKIGKSLFRNNYPKQKKINYTTSSQLRSSSFQSCDSSWFLVSARCTELLFEQRTTIFSGFPFRVNFMCQNKTIFRDFVII